MNSSCFIIAEAGVNHNGDDDLALRLVEKAAECRADAVKFQSFKADKLVRKGTEKAEYQKRNTGNDDDDQYSMLRRLEMSAALHRKLLTRCEELGIEFMSTPFDDESVDFLIELGMKRIKIPSGELTNHPLLAHIAAKGTPIILSTGMSTMLEVQEAVDVIAEVRRREGYTAPLSEILTILHCTSNYPTALDNVNLRAMGTMATELGLPVGYSDHTDGILISVAAVAMGASVIEKHFTLDHDLPGPDHKASLEPAELAEMVSQIRAVEQAMGTGLKQPTESEFAVRQLVRRSVTLVRDIAAGEVVTKEHLALLRPGEGILPKELERVIGRNAARDMDAGTTLQWQDLS